MAYGYHFYVRKNGEIFRGRPEDTVGAHAYGSNSDSIGICAEGNFDVEFMSNEQKVAIAELLRHLTNKYNIDKIQGHRDVCQTSCPGANFPYQEIMDMLNNNVQEEVKEETEENKTIDELAQEVIAGQYGNGEERRTALGDKYNEVQKRVNEILLSKNVENKKSNEEVAREVIAGKYGNGQDRKNKLEAEGYNYNEVQRIVNNMLK